MFCFSRGIEVRVLCEYVHNANKFPAYIWGHLETPRIELNVSQLKRLSNNAFTSQGLSAKSIEDLGLRTKKSKSSLPRGFFLVSSLVQVYVTFPLSTNLCRCRWRKLQCRISWPPNFNLKNSCLVEVPRCPKSFSNWDADSGKSTSAFGASRACHSKVDHLSNGSPGFLLLVVTRSPRWASPLWLWKSCKRQISIQFLCNKKQTNFLPKVSKNVEITREMGNLKDKKR